MERLRFRFESMILRGTQLSFLSSPSPRYYVPGDNPWPFLGALALVLTLSGAATLVLGSHEIGVILLGLGTAACLAVFAGWFISAIGAADVAGFGLAVNRAFRFGMLGFLGVEIFLFGICWCAFAATRELRVDHPAVTPDSLPLMLSSASFLLSSAAVVVALDSLRQARPRRRLSLALALSIVLGVVFLAIQAPHYGYALGLLGAGTTAHRSLQLVCLSIHGVHVVLGLVLLGSLWVHSLRAHFTATQRFGLQAAGWYWHFLDVTWVGLLLLMSRG